MSEEADAAYAESFRIEWGRIVASLIRQFGDWDLAEDAAQDAFARALGRWRVDGVPASPGAWLTTVARNSAIDRLRRARAEAGRHQSLRATLPMGDTVNDDRLIDDDGIADDRLRLLFTCCHPALSLEAQVALTLRTVTGLTTGEIARAFLVSEPTMAKRLVRAKDKIRNAGIPYRVPPAHLLPERTVGVLAVLYLLFNEGYSATAGAELVRTDLCDEAIRIGRLLVQLMPDEPEALGLLALMLFQHSRRLTRVDASGTLIPLDEQDRTGWDAACVTDGRTALDAALRRRRPGPYQIQAAIAACHASATSPRDTDWYVIAALYDKLAELMPNAVVELNRAVAVAMADGAEAGLRIVDQVVASGALGASHLVPATRADLLRRLGRHAEAGDAYRDALDKVATDPERRYLVRRLAELDEAPGR